MTQRGAHAASHAAPAKTRHAEPAHEGRPRQSRSWDSLRRPPPGLFRRSENKIGRRGFPISYLLFEKLKKKKNKQKNTRENPRELTPARVFSWVLHFLYKRKGHLWGACPTPRGRPTPGPPPRGRTVAGTLVLSVLRISLI